MLQYEVWCQIYWLYCDIYYFQLLWWKCRACTSNRLWISKSILRKQGPLIWPPYYSSLPFWKSCKELSFKEMVKMVPLKVSMKLIDDLVFTLLSYYLDHPSLWFSYWFKIKNTLMYVIVWKIMFLFVVCIPPKFFIKA